MVKILSNTSDPSKRGGPLRGFVQVQADVRRSVRRVMKRDPNTSQGAPDNWFLPGKNGLIGRSGASPVRAVLGRKESKQTANGSGIKKIRNRGTNTSLKKR